MQSPSHNHIYKEGRMVVARERGEEDSGSVPSSHTIYNSGRYGILLWLQGDHTHDKHSHRHMHIQIYLLSQMYATYCVCPSAHSRAVP